MEIGRVNCCKWIPEPIAEGKKQLGDLIHLGLIKTQKEKGWKFWKMVT